MLHELCAKVSQHAVRGLGWGVFGAMNEILAPFMAEKGINPTKVAWTAARVEFPPTSEGWVDVLYEVRGRETI